MTVHIRCLLLPLGENTHCVLSLGKVCVQFKETYMIDVKEYLFSLPAKVNADALEGLNTIFHFDISDAGQFTVQVTDGKLSVSEGLSGDPVCKVGTSAASFSKLLSGDLNPMMAMMTGKLKISNPGEMLKYAKMFGLM